MLADNGWKYALQPIVCFGSKSPVAVTAAARPSREHQTLLQRIYPAA
jgi:hypothetical protein